MKATHAVVTPEAAYDVADYLARTIPTACPTGSTTAWGEVRDALYALANDTDFIVTDPEVVTALAPSGAPALGVHVEFLDADGNLDHNDTYLSPAAALADADGRRVVLTGITGEALPSDAMAMRSALADALAFERDAFDDDEEVNGGDLVEWFSGWRETAKAALAGAPSAAPPAPSDAPSVECSRCAGNGEIVTDWDRYKHPHADDKGDEAVAECPDCSGTGQVEAEEAAPADPVKAEMLAALADLLKWAEHTGGWDAPAWKRAADVVQAALAQRVS